MSSTLSRLGPRTAAAIAAMTALALLALLATAPAQAKYATSAMCTATFPVVSINPPFRPFVLISRSGTVSSSGQTGTVNCRGNIDGDWVTGPGTARLEYTYLNGTCVAHVGLGTVVLKIPTAAGIEHLRGALSVRRIGLSILADVRFPHARSNVAGALVPVEGDCLLTPLRKVRATVAGPLFGI